MTLPTGTISISQINTELGASATRNIWLSYGDLRTLAGVPSGTISMSQFRGKSKAVATSFDTTSLNNMPDLYGNSANTTAYARVYLKPDGTWQTFATGTGNTYGRWQSGSDGANYEYRYINSTGAAGMTNGYSGTWYPLSVQRIVEVGAGTGGSSDSVDFTIRQIANPANAITWTVYMEANGACFAVGTLLRTPQGDRTVESILADDLVCSFAEPTMVDESIEGWEDWAVQSLGLIDTSTTATIKGSFTFTALESVKINGIHSTLDHRHFVFDGEKYCWKKARDVTAADSFVDADRQLVAITDIERVTEEASFVALDAETLDTLQVKLGDKYVLSHNVSA